LGLMGFRRVNGQRTNCLLPERARNAMDTFQELKIVLGEDAFDEPVMISR